MTTAHPSTIELSRALSEGRGAAMDAHLAGCPTCSSAWAWLERVDALARELPTAATSPARSEQALAGVLASLTETPGGEREARRVWWPWAAGFGAVALAAAAIVLLVSRDQASDRARVASAGLTYRGAVRAQAGARFERVSAAPDEVVRLHEGTIAVDVMPLQAGERFRVVVSDAEVEVRGTSFDVAVKADALLAVQVAEGVVDVRPAQRAAVVLLAGQRWEAEAPVTAVTSDLERPPARIEVPRPPPPSAAPRSVQAEPRRPAPPPAADPTMARLFDDGWSQLRAGKLSAAIATFDEAIADHPTDPLAEDASFWRAVAMVRSDRGADAHRALDNFLARYPRSPRAGEASAMLGWLLLERGDIDGAERRFRAAADDRVDTVRASAAKGLAAVTATRAR